MVQTATRSDQTASTAQALLAMLMMERQRCSRYSGALCLVRQRIAYSSQVVGRSHKQWSHSPNSAGTGHAGAAEVQQVHCPFCVVQCKSLAMICTECHEGWLTCSFISDTYCRCSRYRGCLCFVQAPLRMTAMLLAGATRSGQTPQIAQALVMQVQQKCYSTACTVSN